MEKPNLYKISGNSLSTLAPYSRGATFKNTRTRTFEHTVIAFSLSEALTKVEKVEKAEAFWEDDGHPHNSKYEKIAEVDTVTFQKTKKISVVDIL
jgi:hypothetical protein